jgi:tetratricopeptide (TPR) repeat protein
MRGNLAQGEAMRLFIERAVAAQPAFRLSEQNTAAVADVCRRLDGIPLALELAAARVRALPVEEIAARLTDRFRLLAHGDRTALPRQQTLRAMIDWSYDLLTERERALLRRLAVFAGGFTLDAAETVGADGLVAEADVLDALTRLVEKSLVVPEPDIGRYRLLETVRQYAHERVEEAGEGDGARGRHLRFYAALAKEAEQKLQGPEQGAWLARLDPERENLLTANAWCDHVEGGAQLGLEMAHSVELYWSYRGLLELGQRVTVEALARAGAQQRTHARCRALVSAANLSYWMGRYPEARGHAEEALAIARELGERERIAGVLRILGRMAQGQGDLGSARIHLEESVAIARQVREPLLLAGALNPLAELQRAEGDIEGAEPLYVEALELRRALGDSSNVAVNLLNLAMIAIAHEAGERARPMLLEAVVIAEQNGSRRLGQAALEVAAGLGAALGQWDDAARFYGAAERQLEEMHIRRAPLDEESLAPLMARVRTALGVSAFAQAEAAGRVGSYEEAMANARTWLENRT